MSHFVCAAILKFKDFFTKTGTYTFSSCGSWTLFTNPAETLTVRFTSQVKEFLDLDFYWLDFLSQLLPYVLTSFTWCGTWGAPLALIQLGLGWWSVSLVSAVGVTWWGVYQRLTVHSYFYIDPILIFSQFLQPSYLFSCWKLFLYIAPHQEDDPTTPTNKQPDTLTILLLGL